jgi:long-chain acyl-CoA synthetase
VEQFFVAGVRSAFPETDPFEALTERSAAGVAFPRVTEDAIAAILYTSGTTARPKGVTHSHAALGQLADKCITSIGLNSEQLSGCFVPLCHMSGFGFHMLPSVRLGATLLIIPRLEPEAVLRALAEHRANLLFGLPVMFNALVHCPGAAACDLSTLEICVAGVVGAPDATWGEVVQAYVALEEGTRASESDLQWFLRERIAAYKIPEAIHFLPELPKGLTGKIDRRALRDRTAAAPRAKAA